MSLLTVPNVFTNGTGPANIIDAVQMNANFTAVATAVNNIYPSQILPITSGQATFGATATGIGYKFLANDATAVPLTVSGVSGQSSDLFDVTLTSGGTKAMSVNSTGQLTSNFGVLLAGTNLPAGANNFIAGDAGANPGVTLNVPTGSTNGFRFQINAATTLLQIQANGLVNIGGSANGLSVNGGNNNATGDGGFARGTTTGAICLGSTAVAQMDYNVTNPTGFSFTANGSTYRALFASAFTISSDASLKTNIAPISGSLAMITGLTPVTFDWKSDGSRSIGFTAQDIQAQFPDAVTTDSDGVLGYQPAAVLAHLVQAFQEYVSTHP